MNGARDAVICMPVRTTIAMEAGGLAPLLPEEFGGQVLQAVVERCGIDPSLVDDVIVGNQFSTARMARHCGLLGGLPVEVPGVTVSRACGSGLQAIINAAQAIQSGADELLMAGGVESYTRAPYLLDKPTEAYQRQPPKFVSAETRGDFGHPELGLDTPMALTAENVAEQYGVSRERQDAFALESQQRAARAMSSGVFKDEVVPIRVPRRRGEPATFETDECPRPDTTLKGLAGLPPAFQKGGTVTAGNACKRADGASMMLVTSPERARSLGLHPIGRLVASAQAGVHPSFMGMGPVPAVRKVLAKSGLSLDEIDLIELNEAFAAQAVPVIDQLSLDPERVNPNGGAIAFGHPTGATGAILTTKLLYEMARRGARYGLVTMCIGGGMGLAAIFEGVRS
jgi:acetyl-CoA C-acetyltransferase